MAIVDDGTTGDAPRTGDILTFISEYFREEEWRKAAEARGCSQPSEATVDKRRTRHRMGSLQTTQERLRLGRL
jgi:hypothetical protein